MTRAQRALLQRILSERYTVWPENICEPKGEMRTGKHTLIVTEHSECQKESTEDGP